MTYTIALEDGAETLDELTPLYKQHYAEMQERLAGDGMEIGDYNMRVREYVAAWRGGWLLNFVVRKDGRAVGYSNVYLTQDMHNSELIAQEDTVYILPAHRNGIGRRLVKYVLEDLRRRGVKRVSITAVTDVRAANLWKRLGFKEVAAVMTYTF